MQATRLISKKWRLIVAFGAIAVLAIGAVLAFALTRPSQADFRSARTTQIRNATKAREALAPAVNTYLAAFKAAYNESNSAEQATQKAKPEFDAYKQAEANAIDAIDVLSSSRIAFDGETGPAITQLEKDYAAEVEYYTGLVESYADYTVLFAKEADRCSGIFVGESDGLADRKAKLDAAATRCLTALDTLKESSNMTYVDYAKKVERRVKRLQADAAATVKAEKTLKQFEARAADYQRQYAEATARGASDAEILELADELKVFNAQIADNKANFDFAAKSYLDTVKEMPTLYGAVYATEVPTKQKYYDQLIDFRTSVFTLLVDSKLEHSS